MFSFDNRILGGFKESLLTKAPTIAILHKDIKEMGFVLIKALIIRNPMGTSSEGVKNTQFLREVMMGIGMKILLSMHFLPKNLVAKGTIIVLRNKNIEEWKATTDFLLHSELNGRGLIIEMIEEEI